MSKNQFKHNVDRELKKLNETIDMKILRGVSYRYEARKHKALLSQSRRVSRQQWFGKFSFFSLF